jgi:hypothetical protein
VISPGTPVSSANKTDRQSSFVQKPESPDPVVEPDPVKICVSQIIVLNVFSVP